MPPLAPGKFADPARTLSGAPRARVGFERLETLWLNTGTRCNLACANCYIESSPTNDRLEWLRLADALPLLEEARAMGATLVGLTGGEPFMNPDIVALLGAALDRGFAVLALTNGMRPLRRHEAALLSLRNRHGDRLRLRVSLDHWSAEVHDAERGQGAFARALDGLRWLAGHGFDVAVAGRHLPGEPEALARAGYARLFADQGLALDAH
ncbi:MAG: radical SAM protein, partial [Sphingomonadaceae bacterium]